MKLHGVGLVVAAALLTGAFAGSGTHSGTHSGPALAARQTGYTVTDLGSLGGTSSAGNSINDRGWVSGYSSLSGNATIHATLWRDGKITDLGTWAARTAPCCGR